MHSTFYGDFPKYGIGIVEDVNDPLKAGRVRVRIFGLHTQDLNIMPTDDLPWSQVMLPITDASLSGIGTTPVGIEKGSQVYGVFLDGKEESKQQFLVQGTMPGIAQRTRVQTNITQETILPGNTNPEKAFHFFVLNGYSEEQAAGIVGNLAFISGDDLNTSRTGGIADWEGERLIALRAFAADRNKEISDLDIQLEWILFELQTSFIAANNKLINSKTTNDAAENFAEFYLDDTRTLVTRQTKAREIKAAYGSTTGSTGNFDSPRAPRENLSSKDIIESEEELLQYLFNSNRQITECIVHHSDTYENQNWEYDRIDQVHTENGFSGIQYHFLILRDGRIQIGRNINLVGTHARGRNQNSIAVCFIGGREGHSSKSGLIRSASTFRPEQWKTFDLFIDSFLKVWPTSNIVGHRDVDPNRRTDPEFDVPSYVETRFEHVNTDDVKTAPINPSEVETITSPEVDDEILEEVAPQEPVVLEEAQDTTSVTIITAEGTSTVPPGLVNTIIDTTIFLTTLANSSIQELNDVSSVTQPTNGQALVYNSTTGQYEPGTVSGGGGGINGIRIEDDGALIVAESTSINFTGAGVTVTDAGSNEVTVNIPGGGGGTTLNDFKESVRVATTANITLSGEQTIDGVLTSTNRVLVKDQTIGSENGIYVTATGAWSRAEDFDQSSEVTAGLVIPVEEGNTNADQLFILTTNNSITLGTTALSFSSLSSGVSTFADLTDTPANYSGQAGRIPTVNSGETGLEFTSPVFKGARLKKSANQNYTASAFATLTWDQEDFDTDNFHDNSTNNSRITIPTGITRIILNASVDPTSATGEQSAFLGIIKNGNTSAIMAGQQSQVTGSSGFLSVSTGVIDVVAGDYFEVIYSSSANRAIEANDASYFACFMLQSTTTAGGGNVDSVFGRTGAIVAASGDYSSNLITYDNTISGLTATNVKTAIDEIAGAVGVVFRGCRLSKSGDQAYTASALATLTWDQEDFDTHSFHDNSTNNSRITIPTGVNKVVLHASANDPNSAPGDNNSFIGIIKNGSTSNIIAGAQNELFANSAFIPVSTGVIDVVAGDYFEVVFASNSNRTLGATASTFFSCHVLDGSETSGIEEGTNVWLNSLKLGASGVASVATGLLEIIGGNGDQLTLDNTGERFTQLNLYNNGDPRVFMALDDTTNRFVIGGQGAYSTFDGITFRPDGSNDDVIIKRDGSIGVGVLSPEAPFHIQSSSTSINSAQIFSDVVLALERNGSTSIQLISNNASTGYLYFADSDSGWPGAIFYQHASDDMVFRANSGSRMTLSSGLQIGSPTGGDKGAGTLNANAVYDDNSLLTCYVLEQEIQGEIDVKDWEKNIVKTTHGPMKKFMSRLGTEYDPMDIDCYAKHWKDKKHLTAMPNKDKYNIETNLSSGEWIQRLVETVEIQAVHIEKLNQRLKKLEK